MDGCSLIYRKERGMRDLKNVDDVNYDGMDELVLELWNGEYEEKKVDSPQLLVIWAAKKKICSGRKGLSFAVAFFDFSLSVLEAGERYPCYERVMDRVGTIQEEVCMYPPDNKHSVVRRIR